MNFQAGDTVMHWDHGLGQITALEERGVMGKSRLYYAVQIQDISIWVPADALLVGRLRRPTPAQAFRQLPAILAGPAEKLSLPIGMSESHSCTREWQRERLLPYAM